MSDENMTMPVQGMAFCATCGAQIAANAPVCIKCGAPNANATGLTSDKSMVVAALLCFFLGAFGAHRFYVGKISAGILSLVLLILVVIFSVIPIVGPFVSLILALVIGIWALVDFIIILTGSFKDKNNLPLRHSFF